jgi:acyl carrier protein
MIEISNFIENFAAVFEEVDPESLKPESKFRDIEEWSSLYALAIIAMTDEKYNSRLTGDDIRNSSTISDIFEIVKANVTN